MLISEIRAVIINGIAERRDTAGAVIKCRSLYLSPVENGRHQRQADFVSAPPAEVEPK